MVEHSLGHLPFQEKCVVTATGHPYTGVDFAKKLCGVSIIRSGESMENALRACCKGIKIGKILVHRCAAARSQPALCALTRPHGAAYPPLRLSVCTGAAACSSMRSCKGAEAEETLAASMCR